MFTFICLALAVLCFAVWRTPLLYEIPRVLPASGFRPCPPNWSVGNRRAPGKSRSPR